MYIQSIQISDRYEDASALNIFGPNVDYIFRKLYLLETLQLSYYFVFNLNLF